MLIAVPILVAAVWLLWRRTARRSGDRAMEAASGGLGRDEAEAEYLRCREALRGDATGAAPLTPQAKAALAERGAWMADRLRGLDGAQTGPAQRIRAKIELIDAVAQDAGRGRPKG